MGDLDEKPKGDSGTWRRVSDKIMAAACGLVLVLVTTVWAITWGSTRADVLDVKEDVQKRYDDQRKADEAQWQIIRELNTSYQLGDRRVTTLEAQQSENSRVFVRFETRQTETDRKIDKLADKVDLVLRELKK